MPFALPFRSDRLAPGIWVCGILVGLLLAGCTDAPTTAPPLDREAPQVRNLSYAPQRVLLATPDPDANVRVPLNLNITADPGSAPVDRVVFSLLASGSNLGVVDTLAAQPQDNIYALAARFALPAVPDQYTLRVFAIGADSLQSNVALGQIRIVPDTTTTP